MSDPKMRSPAPPASGDRADRSSFASEDHITNHETLPDFAAGYIARRYGLAIPLARAIVTLASLARSFA